MTTNITDLEQTPLVEVTTTIPLPAQVVLRSHRGDYSDLPERPEGVTTTLHFKDGLLIADAWRGETYLGKAYVAGDEAYSMLADDALDEASDEVKEFLEAFVAAADSELYGLMLEALSDVLGTLNEHVGALGVPGS